MDSNENRKVPEVVKHIVCDCHAILESITEKLLDLYNQNLPLPLPIQATNKQMDLETFLCQKSDESAFYAFYESNDARGYLPDDIKTKCRDIRTMIETVRDFLEPIKSKNNDKLEIYYFDVGILTEIDVELPGSNKFGLGRKMDSFLHSLQEIIIIGKIIKETLM